MPRAMPSRMFAGVPTLRRLPYRQAADGIAAAVGIVEGEGMFDRPATQVRIDAALDDREHHLAIAVKRFRLVEMAGKTLQPALGEAQ